MDDEEDQDWLFPFGGDYDRHYGDDGTERDRAERSRRYRMFNSWENPEGAPTDETWNDWSRGIPLLDLDAEDRAAMEQFRQQQLWGRLAQTAPTVDELSTELFTEGNRDEYGDLHGGSSALEGLRHNQAAMDALRPLMEGGLSEADRAAMRAAQLQRGQQLGAANQAAIQQAAARGMGGGGAELAARLGGSQAYANANAMGDAAQMQAAQQRMFQAAQAYGGLANQQFGQEAQRRASIDQWNRGNLDWRRQRESQNTERQYRHSRDRADAYQQSHQNMQAAVAGFSGHNPYGSVGDAQNRTDENARALLGTAATLITS